MLQKPLPCKMQCHVAERFQLWPRPGRLCPPLSMGPWVSYLMFLNNSFHICKIGKTLVACKGCFESCWINLQSSCILVGTQQLALVLVMAAIAKIPTWWHLNHKHLFIWKNTNIYFTGKFKVFCWQMRCLARAHLLIHGWPLTRNLTRWEVQGSLLCLFL